MKSPISSLAPHVQCALLDPTSVASSFGTTWARCNTCSMSFFFQRTNKSSCAFVHQWRWTLTMIHSKKSSKHLVKSRLLNALTIPFKLDLDCVLSTAHRTEIKSATKIGLFVKRLWSLYICEMTAFHVHKWAVYFESCIHTSSDGKRNCVAAVYSLVRPARSVCDSLRNASIHMF